MLLYVGGSHVPSPHVTWLNWQVAKICHLTWHHAKLPPCDLAPCQVLSPHLAPCQVTKNSPPHDMRLISLQSQRMGEVVGWKGAWSLPAIAAPYLGQSRDHTNVTWDILLHSGALSEKMMLQRGSHGGSLYENHKLQGWHQVKEYNLWRRWKIWWVE